MTDHEIFSKDHPSNIPFPSATLIRVEVGSGVHGIAQEGTDDRDEMGVCFEPYDRALGVSAIFEQYIHRSAAVREGRLDAPSQPGDLDLTIYSLRKWVRLALKGNPTVLTMLFAPDSHTVYCSPIGQHLRDMAGMFASKEAGWRFLGYLQAQRSRLLGERGQRNVNRHDLIEKFGFDTKYAGHMLRLGYQGVEFMETGRLTLPMPPTTREYCIAARRGEIPLQKILTETGKIEQELRDLISSTVLPDEADYKSVEAWMLEAYWQHWKATYEHEEIIRRNQELRDR